MEGDKGLGRRIGMGKENERLWWTNEFMWILKEITHVIKMRRDEVI
jgi:hypothetical protein